MREEQASSYQWRVMGASDVPDVIRMASIIHTDYPEADEVFFERQTLYPAGCLLLTNDTKPTGYLLSHPWHFGQPPELDMLLGSLPTDRTSYYIHDFSLLPQARGTGAARAGVSLACDIAKDSGAKNVALVAVGGSNPFWQAMGFTPHHDPALTMKLKSYDENAAYMVKRLEKPIPA